MNQTYQKYLSGELTITQATGIKHGSLDRTRELVRLRDNHTCQKCGKKWVVGERRLDVHHLDEERESTKDCKWDRENMDRMITYCHKCHLTLDSIIKKMQQSWEDIKSGKKKIRSRVYRVRYEEIRKRKLKAIKKIKTLLDKNLSYAEIGSIVGLSTEYVRVLCQENDLVKPKKQPKRIDVVCPRCKKVSRRHPNNKQHHCSMACRKMTPEEKEATKKARYKKATIYLRERYKKDPNWRAKVKEYNKRSQAKLIARGYYKTEEFRKKTRERYQKKAKDPKYLEKRRAYFRELYRKKILTSSK